MTSAGQIICLLCGEMMATEQLEDHIGFDHIFCATDASEPKYPGSNIPIISYSQVYAAERDHDYLGPGGSNLGLLVELISTSTKVANVVGSAKVIEKLNEVAGEEEMKKKVAEDVPVVKISPKKFSPKPPRPHLCEICGQKFAYRRALMTHVGQGHSGVEKEISSLPTDSAYLQDLQAEFFGPE